MGKRISQHRVNKGFTQEYLAEQLGVSRQAVSKWGNNITSPDTNNLIALSELLGVSVDCLCSGNEENTGIPNNERLSNVWKTISILLFLLYIGLNCIGIFTGSYTDMVSIGGLGIWFLLYGRSSVAISLLISASFCLFLSTVFGIVSYSHRNHDKKTGR